MANECVNKVVLPSGETLIDLTGDDVTSADVLSGITFHLPNGVTAEGRCAYDADTKDATATAADILADATAYANGAKVTGGMANNGSVTLEITDKAQEVTIPGGYHDGGGKAKIAAAEQENIVANNIRQGITILGVEGSMSGSENVKAQAKSATPTLAEQRIKPDTGYTHLTQVTIAAIPVAYSDNDFGGQTVTIG